MYDGICIVSFTLNEPVNSCVSEDWSPNLLEPDENITEDDMNVVCNSVVVIFPATLISPLKIPLPVTIKNLSILTPVFISNPLFGDIAALAEPDVIWSKSPIESADMFVIAEPSPLKKDADTVPVVNKEPVISVLTFIESLSFDILAVPAPL